MQGFPGVQAQAPPHAPGPVAGGSAPPPGPDPASAPEATYAELLEKAHRLASAAAAEDNKRACQPHVNVPFADLDDAIARLLPYHVFTAGDEDEADLGVVPARFEDEEDDAAPIPEDLGGAGTAEPNANASERGPLGGAREGGGAPATTAGADLKRDGASEKAPERAPEKAPEANPSESPSEGSGPSAKAKRRRVAEPARSRAQAWAESRVEFVRAFASELESKRVRVEAQRRCGDPPRPSANAEPSSEPSSGPSPSALTAAEAYLVAAKVSEEARRRDAADRLERAEAERERKQRAEAERARAQAEARARAEQAARESAARAAAAAQRMAAEMAARERELAAQRQQMAAQHQAAGGESGGGGAGPGATGAPPMNPGEGGQAPPS